MWDMIDIAPLLEAEQNACTEIVPQLIDDMPTTADERNALVDPSVQNELARSAG